MAPPGGGSKLNEEMQALEFNAQEFDTWAASYDQDVLVEAFPFEGYMRVLDAVLALAGAESGMRVLDLGTGTGNLARRFLDVGCRVWCTDYSRTMLARAQRKLPEAICFALDLRHDLSAQYLPQVLTSHFDRIISSYVFHHFPLDSKIDILTWMADLLSEKGRMVIGDIAFSDQNHLESARRNAGDAWEEEYYWVAPQVLPALERAGLSTVFQPVSLYAGVFVITPVRGRQG